MRPIETILRCLRSSTRVEREVDDELRFHIEMRARDNFAAGMTKEEAEASALRRFGNYQCVKDACCEISRERLAGMNLKTIKGIIWVMLGCGLTLKIGSGIKSVAQAGEILTVIAILWRLWLYLRAAQPDEQRIKAAEQMPLSILEPSVSSTRIGLSEQPQKTIPARDEQGRTPVERLIADEESEP